MTVLEAVKRGHTSAFMYGAAIKTAQAALTEPETVLWAHTGNVLLNLAPGSVETVLKPGVTVITTHRILFAHSAMGRQYTRTIALLDISDINAVADGFLMSLHMHGLTDYLAIQGNTKTIKEFIAALQDAAANTKNIDPDTLAAFQSPLAAKPGTPAEEIDLDPYFQTYYPSSTRAAQKLHQDTDLDMQQCKQMVEAYFSANLARAPKPREESFPDLKHAVMPGGAELYARKKELDQQGIAYCPKCASTSITAGKRGFSFDRAVAGSFFFSTETNLRAGALGADEKECFCMKCGHTWKP